VSAAGGSSDLTTTPGAVPAGFRGVALSALLAGLCPLIPLPFVDWWALTVVRRRAVADLLRGEGLAAGARQVRILAGEEAPRGGCIVGVLIWGTLKVLFYILRKVFRTLLFVLTLRESVHRASELFTEAYLLRHAAARGVAAAALAAGDDGARRLRAAVAATAAEVDDRPLRRTIRGALAGSWGLLRRGARSLVRGLRRSRGAPPEERVPVAEEAGLLGGVLDRLTAALWLQESYRRRLEERFAAHWATPAATAPLYYDRAPAAPREVTDPNAERP
jgi:hypothetical protein